MMYASIFHERVDKLIQLDILRVTPTITKTVDYRQVSYLIFSIAIAAIIYGNNVCKN